MSQRDCVRLFRRSRQLQIPFRLGSIQSIVSCHKRGRRNLIRIRSDVDIVRVKYDIRVPKIVQLKPKVRLRHSRNFVDHDCRAKLTLTSAILLAQLSNTSHCSAIGNTRTPMLFPLPIGCPLALTIKVGIRAMRFSMRATLGLIAMPNWLKALSRRHRVN